MGAHAEKVGGIAELEAAMARARGRDRSYVIVIDTDPMPTTEAGGHWWDVAVPEVSARESVRGGPQGLRSQRATAAAGGLTDDPLRHQPHRLVERRRPDPRRGHLARAVPARGRARSASTASRRATRCPTDPAALKAALAPHGLRFVSGWHSLNLLARSVEDEKRAIQPHLDLLKAMGCEVSSPARPRTPIHGHDDRPLVDGPDLHRRRMGELRRGRRGDRRVHRRRRA